MRLRKLFVFFGCSLFLLEVQADTIDAITIILAPSQDFFPALALEDMSQMWITVQAANLNSLHAQWVVHILDDVVVLQSGFSWLALDLMSVWDVWVQVPLCWCVEAWPSTAGIKHRWWLVQQGATVLARVVPHKARLGFVFQKRRGEWSFCALESHDMEFFLSQIGVHGLLLDARGVGHFD